MVIFLSIVLVHFTMRTFHPRRMMYKFVHTQTCSRQTIGKSSYQETRVANISKALKKNTRCNSSKRLIGPNSSFIEKARKVAASIQFSTIGPLLCSFGFITHSSTGQKGLCKVKTRSTRKNVHFNTKRKHHVQNREQRKKFLNNSSRG